ncbi:MAG: hypothetical protein IJ309_07885 [Clostridia bacterium]|nr:hypothetical protein [Clostridia bacterium]MBQ7907870.1 hypothetical protein [Clostridia bacterium]
MSKEKNVARVPLSKNKTFKKVLFGALGVLAAAAIIVFIIISVIKFTEDSGPKYDESYVYDGFSLVGTWREYEHDDSGYILYEYKADNTITKTSYTYGIKDQQIVGTYTVTMPNSITIRYEGEGDEPVETSNFSIDEWGTLVLYTLGDMGYRHLGYVKNDLEFSKGENPLLGDWRLLENNDVNMHFGSDSYGYLYYVSSPNERDDFAYSWRGDNELYMLYVIRFEGTPDIPTGSIIAPGYRIEDDRLTIYGNDSNGNYIEQVYERIK